MSLTLGQKKHVARFWRANHTLPMIYIYFFNHRFDHGGIELLSWFGINLIVSFKYITQNIFCSLAKSKTPTSKPQPTINEQK